MKYDSARFRAFGLCLPWIWVCTFLTVTNTPAPTHGQCAPQQLPKITALDAGPSDFFGQAIAISGDTAVIGAHGDQGPDHFGAAYVFVRSGGVWTQQAKLIASDFGNYFAWSVAISG